MICHSCPTFIQYHYKLPDRSKFCKMTCLTLICSVVSLTIAISASPLSEGNKSPCSQPLVLGRICNFATAAQSTTQRYYYDPVNNCCSSFSYLGCGGNGNNFMSAGRCLRSCLQKDPANEDVDSDEDEIDVDQDAMMRTKADCLLQPDPGPCRALISMWYWNKEASTCELFSWGGCQGNWNRFDGEQECTEFCGGNNTSIIAEMAKKRKGICIG